MEVENLGTNVAADGGISILDYLPVELVLYILSRIDDAKILCKCIAVSKQFASLIYQIKSVSLRLPRIDADSFKVYSDYLLDTRAILYFEDDESTWPIHPSSIQKIAKMVAFLTNFRELEYVDIESVCPRIPCTSPLVRWKARLDRSEPAVTGLVSINPTSMYRITEGEEFVELEEYQVVSSSHDNLQDDSLYPLISCTEWLFLILSLIKSHDSLQRVICTDSHRHGAFVLEVEQIGEWRQRMIRVNDGCPIGRYPGSMGGGWCSELHLPVAGYLMNKVNFMFMNCPVNGVHDDVDDEEEFEGMMNWAYGEDEAVLREAVKEIIESVVMD